MKNLVIFFMVFFILFQINHSISQTIYSNDNNDNVEVTSLTDKIYLLRETISFTANIVAFAGSDGVILFDTGFKNAANGLVDAVKHLQSGKVKYIINSHAHSDHVGANSFFGDDVTVIGYKKCEESFTKGGLKVITFDKEYSFTYNEEEIKCIAFSGGHSPCDIVIHVPTLKIIYLGDMYLSESFPLVVTETGAMAQILVKNLKKILSILPDDTRVIPGHGKVTTREYFKNYIDMVETTIGIVRKEMAAGKSLKEIQNADVLKDWGEWGTFFEFITKESWIEDIYMSYSEK